MEFSLGFGWGALAVAALWSAKTTPQADELGGDAFRLDRQSAPPSRWNVIGRLRESVIRYAARQWGKL